MAYVDLSSAHDRCAALREVIIHHPGGWADRAALDKVEHLCGTVRAAVDDIGCHERVEQVEKFAAVLYSETAQQSADPQRTNSGMTRAGYLRLQILRELNELDARLLAIEKLRGEARRAETGYLLNTRG